MPGSLTGVKAGRAFIVIDAVDKTGRIMKRIGFRIRRWAADINGLAHSLAQMALIAAAPIALSARAFVSFDDAMRRVEARTAGTAEEMAKLRHQARELGRETSTTATEIANLQAALAQKGFSRADIFQMTPHIRNLAEAAGAGTSQDFITAADLVAGTLLSFGKGAQDAARMADIFTYAVNNSNFTLEGLLDTLSKTAALAADFGMTIEETVATLASMTNLNIPASEAGTALVSFLARMSKSEFVDKFNDKLEALTDSTIDFTDEAKNLRKPLELLDEIGRATAGLGTAERGDLLSVLFGVRQFGKATGSARGAVGALEFLNDLMDKSGNAAEETARKMNEGVGGAFRRIWSLVVDLALTLSRALEPAFKAVEGTVKRVHTLFASLIQLHSQTVRKFVAVTAAVLALAAGLKLVGITLNLLAPLFLITGNIISAFATGLSLVTSLAAAIPAVVAGIAAFISQVVFVGGFIIGVFAEAGLAVTAFVATAAGAIAGIGILLVIAFTNALQAVAQTMRGFFADFMVFLNGFGRALGTFATSILDSFQLVAQALQSGQLELAAELAAKGFELAFREAFESIRDAFDTMIHGWHIEMMILAEKVPLVGDKAQAEQLRRTKAFRQEMERTWNEAHISDPMIEKLREEMETLAAQIVVKPEGEGGNRLKQLQENLNQLAQSPAFSGMGGGQVTSAMRAMESKQTETVREIAKLRQAGLQKPMKELIGIAAQHLGVAEETLEAIEKGGVETIGP